MRTCAEARAYNRAYYLAHREQIKAATASYYKRNRDKMGEAGKRYVERNKEKTALYRKQWRKDNREKLNAYYVDRRKNHPLYRLEVNVRARVGLFLRKGIGRKIGSTMVLVGCTWSELRSHLESMFTPGMNWENYGSWHIDHVIPLCEAKSDEDVIRLCNYKNLQPLWALDNLRKNRRTV